MINIFHHVFSNETKKMLIVAIDADVFYINISIGPIVLMKRFLLELGNAKKRKLFN